MQAIRADLVTAGDWGRLLPVPAEKSSFHAFGNGIAVRRFRHGSYAVDDVPGCRDHLFAFRLAGSVKAERKLDGGWRKAATRSGSITVMPAGQTSSWRLGGGGEMLHFFFPPRIVADIAGEDGYRPEELLPAAYLGILDLTLGRLVESFAREMEQGMAGHELYAEALTVQIIVTLARHHLTQRGRSHPSRGFGWATEKALVEFVEENLADRITLGQLAGVASVGLSRLNALFRLRFGCSPYAYVLQRRIAKAKALLRESDLGLAEIALAAGFSHQAHFTTTFRRLCGATPASYRAEIRR